MIRLKSPLNHGGTIYDEGVTIGFLPIAQQEQLVENNVAEFVTVEVASEGFHNDTKKTTSSKQEKV